MKNLLMSIWVFGVIKTIFGIAWTVTFWGVFCVFVLAACGTGTVSSPQGHGVFEPYFQKFEVQSVSHGRSTYGDSGIVIEMTDKLSSEEEGECNTGLGDWGIKIKESKWNTSSDTDKTILIAHELGHCLLDRTHKNETFNFEKGFTNIPKAPVSIMNADLMIATQFDADPDRYWDELFGGAQ
jgi:hypothetical protein